VYHLFTSDSIRYDEDKKKVNINTSGCGCCSDHEEYTIEELDQKDIESYIADIQQMLDEANKMLEDKKKVANG
jgi:hypothetical protein